MSGTELPLFDRRERFENLEIFSSCKQHIFTPPRDEACSHLHSLFEQLKFENIKFEKKYEKFTDSV